MTSLARVKKTLDLVDENTIYRTLDRGVQVRSPAVFFTIWNPFISRCYTFLSRFLSRFLPGRA